MNKEEVERIALEVAKEMPGLLWEEGCIQESGILKQEATEFATRCLARIDAERGKEAVAWRFVDDEDGGHVSFQKSPPTKEQIEYLARWNRPKWEPLFLSAPTIPEGMALVKTTALDEVLEVLESIDDGDTQSARRVLIEMMLADAQGERK